MSERTGIPLSTIAKVEHDRLTLTYDKLLQLSERLNIRMSDLFSEADASPDAPITARRSIGRLGDAIRVNTPNYEYFYMCPELRHKRMVPTVTRVRARSIEEFGELVHHRGARRIEPLDVVDDEQRVTAGRTGRQCVADDPHRVDRCVRDLTVAEQRGEREERMWRTGTRGRDASRRRAERADRARCVVHQPCLADARGARDDDRARWPR